jgi:hypothetical protein
MQTVEIIDPNGFERAMRAATISIPAGWTFQGQVRWQPRATCQVEATQITFAAQDPSGRFAVEIIPGTGWQANNLQVAQPGGGCAFLAINSPRQYLDMLVAKARPGARVLDYRDRADLVAAPGKPPVSALAGVDQQNIVSAGEVLIAYEQNGAPVREVIQVVVEVSIMRMAGVFPGEVREFLNGVALAAFAMRAPEGQLDFRAADVIRASFALDPVWQSKMAGHGSAIAATIMSGNQARFEISQDANRAVGQIIQEGFDQRNASSDRIHDKFGRMISDETQYQTPDGRVVNLPSYYDNAWQTPDGGFIMGNGGFDPNRDLGVSGTQLTPTE